MARSFADVLDECLDRVLLRGEAVDACVADYPEHATELRKALEAALTVHQAASLQPDQARKRASRLRFLEAVERRSRQGWLRRWLSGRLTGARPRWAMAISALVIAIVMGSTGTVVAAESSVPGDPLYPVKRVGERARLMLSFTDHREADIHAQLLDRRMEELQAVTDKGAVRFVPRLVDEIARHSQRARVLTELPVRRAVAEVESRIGREAHRAPEPAPTLAEVASRVRANQLLRLHHQLASVEEQLNHLFGRSLDAPTRRELDEVVQMVKTHQRQTASVLDRMDAAHLAEDQLRRDAPDRERDDGTERPSDTPREPMRRVHATILAVDVVVGRGYPRLDLTIELANGERQVVHLSRGETHLRKGGVPGRAQDLRVGSDVVLEVETGTRVVRYVLIAE